MKHLREFNEITESLGGRDISSIDRMKNKYPKGIEIPKEIKATGTGNFSIGVDSLDPESKKFMEIVEIINDLLQNSKGEVKVKVSSGASAVGQGKYDNQGLAERRRDNTIEALKKYPFIDPKRITFIPGKATVGKATVKGSKEAENEQYVNVEVSGTGSLNVPVTGVQGDNTNVYRPELFKFDGKRKDSDDDDFDFTKTKIKRICLQLPDPYVEKFIQLLGKFRRDNGFEKIPYGIYDIEPKK
jgi:hypothetical protein